MVIPGSGAGEPAEELPAEEPVARASSAAVHLKDTVGSYSRLEKVGIWAWDELGWFSFFSGLWGWRTVTFQLSGFHCKLSDYQISHSSMGPFFVKGIQLACIGVQFRGLY